MRVVIICSLLAACGGSEIAASGGSETTTILNVSNPTPTIPTISHSLSGQIQKGPLIFGSRIWVSELDGDLNPTGKTYLSQTTDDLGNFTISTTVTSDLVELLGVGYYMDEITGSLSTSQITLSAIADLSVDETPTINILTTLQAPRVKRLMQDGVAYTEANSRSQTEVLAIFGIDSSKIDALESLFAMDITGSTDQDSALLATSAIIAKMSSTAATANGSSQAAEMSFYISNIGSDIANYGLVNSTDISTAIDNASAQIDLNAIRTNVETYYANRNITVIAPKFEEWVDKDNSGLLPKRKITATSQTFTDDLLVNPNEVITSNSIAISGVGSDNIYTELITGSICSSAGVNLLKNGDLVSGSFTTLAEDDTLRIRSTSPSWGQSCVYTANVGSQSLDYKVTTKPLVTTFYQGADICQSQDSPNSDYQYIAVPFYTDQLDFISSSIVNSQYIGIGLLTSGPTSGPLVPTRIEIHADNAGSPSGTSIATAVAGNGTYGLDIDTVNDSSGNSYTTNRLYIQGYFGSDGVDLQANTKYWAVTAYSAPTRTHLELCGAVEPVSYGTVKTSSDGSTWADAGLGAFPKLFLFQ